MGETGVEGDGLWVWSTPWESQVVDASELAMVREAVRRAVDLRDYLALELKASATRAVMLVDLLNAMEDLLNAMEERVRGRSE